jgi:hemoglobin/transferrin/lactoferrin receptor protein
MVRARVRLSVLLLGLAPAATAQEGDEAGPLGRTIVTARRPALEADVTGAVTETITREDLERRLPRTVPKALERVPGVLLQETSMGQGSPYLRGFTGFRNLFLIDGIRLNNSVFRDGPNQYWNTVDPFSIASIEVVKGPSTVVHGSDAIGGTVRATTRSPWTFGPGTNAGVDLASRFASAESSLQGSVAVSVTGGDEWGGLLGLTGKDFGELQTGDGVQRNTGYDEWGADLKVERFLGDSDRVTFAYQEVRQDDVPRTHRTTAARPFEGTTVGSDLLRDLDQERRLAYLQLSGGTGGEDDAYALSLSWHEQEEERDRVRGSGARELQGFEVGTLGLLGNLASDTAAGRVTVGFDWYHDDVDSFSTRNPIQGPVGDDATYDLIGVFVQDELAVSDDVTVTLGARLNHARADADSVSDPVSGLRTSVEDDWTRVVGSARFEAELAPEGLALFGGVSQGSRAPNLSDLTRFDSARTNEFEIASPGLDPEDFLTYELGLRRATEESAAELAVFYTDIDDAIVRVPTGATTVDGEAIITKDNVGDGHVFGVEAAASRALGGGWTAFGTAAYLDGKADTYPTSVPVAEEEYLDRLMPTTVLAGLEWEEEQGGRWFEVTGTWRDDADRLSTRDENDTSRIPPGGTPGHLVVDLRGGLVLGRGARLTVALENVTDEDYRIHGSGQNAPGRSLVLGLTVRR